jgi:hypothetical protein
MIIFDYDPKSGISCGINDEIRFKALLKHVEDWESISFDLYKTKRDKYGEVDQEVAILKGEWKVWNMLLALMKDDRRMAQLALRYFGRS